MYFCLRCIIIRPTDKGYNFPVLLAAINQRNRHSATKQSETHRNFIFNSFFPENSAKSFDIVKTYEKLAHQRLLDFSVRAIKKDDKLGQLLLKIATE